MWNKILNVNEAVDTNGNKYSESWEQDEIRSESTIGESNNCDDKYFKV